MDYDQIPAAAFGASLSGITINILTRDVRAEAAFLADAFGCTIHRLSGDYAIARHIGADGAAAVLQIHSDASFARHPLHALLPESSPRGAGIEIRLHGANPDLACERAAQIEGAMILSPATNKPGHGLREAVILSPSGYAFVPSIALQDGAS
jgi:hypothetical protein